MKRRGQWGHIINMVGLSGHRIPDGPQVRTPKRFSHSMAWCEAGLTRKQPPCECQFRQCNNALLVQGHVQQPLGVFQSGERTTVTAARPHHAPVFAQGGGFYCATKSAVKTITEGLRQEVGGAQSLVLACLLGEVAGRWNQPCHYLHQDGDSPVRSRCAFSTCSRIQARGQKLPLRVSGISPGIVETEFFAVGVEVQEGGSGYCALPCAYPAQQPASTHCHLSWN